MHAVDVVVVYYKPGCPYSAMLFAKMKLRGVPYTAVRFQDDPQGARKVREVNNGNEISPTVRVGGRYLANPSLREVREALTVT
jgi:mycoredoxin